MYRKGVLTVLSLLMALGILAQDNPPHGNFLADSMKIGQPVPYALSYRYNASRDVIFPDSLFDFSPFELDHKTYFPTATANGISYDSAVYYLSYFELDTFQIYSLPVFEVIDSDSSRLIPAPDTIYLQQVVSKRPDSVAVEALPLKENTDYMNVPLALNYPYIIIGVIIFFIAVALVIYFFGSQIRAAWRIFMLKRKHRKFREQFNSLISSRSGDFRQHAERVIILWKRYLQQLEQFPYTSLTTRELIQDHPDQQLSGALHAIDSAIYDPHKSSLDQESLGTLMNYAENRFEQKVNQIKNG
ncbi:MAG: hypothetical protein P8X57_02270 [Cyclobacteriaceae bacterium]